MIADQFDHQYILGHCAQKYARSLADPFSGPPDACMPVTPACLSRKLRTFVRTQLVTSSTSGDGFVTMQPFIGNDIINPTTAGAAAYYSTATYVGGGGAGFPVLNNATAGVNAVSSNSDYVSTSFGLGLQCRLVSMGLRVRYSGTELNRGGRVILLEDPEHATLSGVNLATILANEKAKEHKIGMDWITLCSTGPTMPQEYDYIPSPTFPLTSTTPLHYLGAYIRSAALQQTFDVELFWNWEVIGQNARGKTMSEADDAGVGVVLGAIKSVNDNQLDTRHPLVAATKTGASPVDAAKALNGIVQRYAAKNTSGWFAKAVKGVSSFAHNAEHYIERGAQIAGAAAPLLALL